MGKYDEKAVSAFRNVKEVVASMDLPLMVQRRYNGTLNAIEMQIEDGRPSKEVIGHLRAALFALAKFDGLISCERFIQKAFDEFEIKIASRMSRP